MSSNRLKKVRSSQTLPTQHHLQTNSQLDCYYLSTKSQDCEHFIWRNLINTQKSLVTQTNFD